MAGPSERTYEYSREALYHPERRPVFVQLASAPAFEVDSSEFSLANAWWLANVSHLTYFARQNIEHHLDRAGLALHALVSRRGILAFVAAGSRFAVLAFRGTVLSEPGNLRNDIDIRHARTSEGVFVHEGFLHGLETIWPDIDAALDRLTGRGYKIWYTGHSLGAAMATLAVARRPPAGVYSFGSPRVGNDGFANALAGTQIFRCVNCCDAITLLPPAQLGFRHVGKELFITSGQEFISTPSARTRYLEKARGYLQYFGKLPWLRPGGLALRSMADHIIVNYVHAIRANLPVGTRNAGDKQTADLARP